MQNVKTEYKYFIGSFLIGFGLYTVIYVLNFFASLRQIIMI
jgi:hypothetical protein